MSRSNTKRIEEKRMDVLLALPLERFRRALAGLSSEALAALAARLGVQQVRLRWARGGFGVDRHRSRQDLALLARREAALRIERESRTALPTPPIPLVFPENAAADTVDTSSERQAA